jgi:DNA-binding NarL/FixJ family response regulator
VGISPSSAGTEPSSTATRRIRLVVADDHALMRQGLRAVLSEQCDLEMVGEAQDGLGALAMASEKRPDVVLMDVNMPHMDGIEATKRISGSLSGVKVIALTMHDNPRIRAAMEAAGASAFITKGEDAERLCQTIRKVYGV